MTKGDIIDEVLVRSGKDTTSGWISDTILDDWASQAHRWAAGYHKWTVTEGKTSTTFTTTREDWDFEGYKADSFRIVQIGGKRLRELNFEDYQIFKEESSAGDDRVYAEFGGLVYINTLVDLTGTLTAWGQYMPANFDATDLTESTVFTEGNDEGNQAIIEEMIGYAFKRDGKRTEAIEQHLLAKKLLDELWDRMEQEKYQKQTHPDRGGMWRRLDILNGTGYGDEFKRDQF